MAEDLRTPERPLGHIRVNVSQPDLLYQFAKEPVGDMSRSNSSNTEISNTGIADSLFTGEQTNFIRYDQGSYGVKDKCYGYETRLLIDTKSGKGHYSAEQTARILQSLRSQNPGVNPRDVEVDTVINGQQRLKIYHPGGNFGIEVFLRWQSQEEEMKYRIDSETRMVLGVAKKTSVDQLTEAEKEKIQQEARAQYNYRRGIGISLVNRSRLDTGFGSDMYPVVPPAYDEFLQQTEFYRKTLEQVLKALYDEAQVTPNIDITLRPPNLSGDSLDRMASISPDTAQSVTTEQLKSETVTLDDIKGQPDAVREARRLVRAINEPHLYEKRGIKPPRGILLVGPPGTGKTMLAKGIASEANAEFVSINAANVGSKWINESAQLMNAVFNDAERKVAEGKKVIIFIDEIDAIASNRDTRGMHPEDIKALSIMLQRLDGVMTRPGVTLLATTNREGAIDPAILRPGRIDKIIPVELPNEEGRKDLLEYYIEKAKKRAKTSELLFDLQPNDIHVVVTQTTGLSGAEIENLINRALENALDLELEGKGWHPVNANLLINSVPVVRTETQRRRKLGFIQ